MRLNHKSPSTILAWCLLVVVGLGAGVAMQKLWKLRTELERLANHLSVEVGPQSTLIFDGNNNLVSALFEEHRIAVPLEKISAHMTHAVLATEDKRFYDHDGVDVVRIAAAAIANSRAGGIVQGGSTITQQLVRSLLLDRERTYKRKIKEAILARRLEEQYSKHDILQAYLNRVYFGDGYYGVEAAAIGYFGKSATELDAPESATLAGLIKGPSVYSPTKAPDKARERRDWVLGEMRTEGAISDEEYQAAVSVPVKILLARGDKTGVQDPRHVRGGEYFRDAVTRELIERFGADAVYTGGLRVYTTLDRSLQRIAEDVISSRLKGTPRGGREPLQGALVAIDPRTGHVKALVGGRNYRESNFNRALESRRQPGSAFKPFIYAVALETGMSPGSQIQGLDQPIPSQQGPWLPDGEHEVSQASLRDALVRSSNRAAAHLLQQVGIHRTIDLVQRFGINSPMPPVPSLALGTGEVTLFELTSAYGVFANSGVWKEPTLIRRVTDRYGREIYKASEVERRVISENTAYLMTTMMSDVVDHGTGTAARAYGFRMQAAGKTGTSNDYTDAWFVGYTPAVVTGVWFGHDKPRTIMDRGFASVIAVPAWARFMRAALRDTKDNWFDMPGGLAKVKLCRLSGMLATDRCHEPVYEYPAYDPNNPNVVAAARPMARHSGVYEEVMPYDRVPQPCTMLHGAPTAPAYDPSLLPGAPHRASSVEQAPETPVLSIYPTPPDSPPVTPPPPFMTERPRPMIVPAARPNAAPPPPSPSAKPTAVEPTPAPIPETAKPLPAPAPAPVTPAPPSVPAPTPPPAAKPAPVPEPEVENPITKPPKPVPEQDPATPIVPGSKIEKAPPPPPPPPKKPPVPPGGAR